MTRADVKPLQLAGVPVERAEPDATGRLSVDPREQESAAGRGIGTG
jgi:hypothetical protein